MALDNYFGLEEIGTRMLKLLATALMLLAAPVLGAQCGVQPDPEEARILTMENAWNQAAQQKDAAALQLLLAPGLIYVEL